MAITSRPTTALELFGDLPSAEVGRDRLVHTAIRLFYHHGINPIGLDRVLAEAGVTKTTFYKHFDSKDDLVVAALETRDAWELAAWASAVRRLVGNDPRAQLNAVVDALDIWFNDAQFGGCQFINAAAEFPNPNDPIHRAAARHKLAQRNWFRELAVAAGALDPDGFADAYTMVFEGILILRQVHDRCDAAKAGRPLIASLIDQHIPITAD